MRNHAQHRAEPPALTEVVVLFEALTGLRAVPRTGAGAPVHGSDGSLPRFCQLVRDAAGGAAQCHACVAVAAPPAGRGRLFRCRSGLTSGVVRLPAPDGDAALISFGPVLPAPAGPETRARLVREGVSRGADDAALQAALGDVRVVPTAELEAAVELLAALLRWRAARISEDADAAAADPAARAAAYVEQHFRRELTLEEVAGHVGLSPAYLSTLFKRRHGVGLKRFLRGLRLEEARWLLEEPSRTVEQVAEAVGFADPHYFSRVFSQAMGMPPTEYRRRLAAQV